MSRTFALLSVSLHAASAFLLVAQDTNYPPDGIHLPGPGGGRSTGWVVDLMQWNAARSGPVNEREAWINDLKQWRAEKWIRMGYSDAEYRRPELAWTQSSFVQPQMMAEERYFYDPVTRKYTVDRYLDDLIARYGGIDAVLIWPVYPNIGIDNRNQWDMIRDMPGGIAGLKQMVADFHRRKVRVLFPAMPWDTGTRDEGVPHGVATARLLGEIGADGVNGDTFEGVPMSYRTASDATGHPIAIQPEIPPSHDELLLWNTMSWGSFRNTPVPAVSKLKWLEPRHMMNISNRWARDHSNDLQMAFFNGIGFESWENIWGIFNQLTPRDAEALRRIATIDRQFAAHLISKDWEPHVPTLQFGIFASRWPLAESTLWTIINKNEYNVSGEQLRIPGHRAGVRYFDVWHGVELQPRVDNGAAVVNFAIEANGFGAVLAVVPGGPVPDLTTEARLAARPLSSYSSEWKPIGAQTLAPVGTTAGPATPGMIRIPAGTLDFKVGGVEIEGSNWISMDVQYPWEDSARRHHRQRMDIPSFYIDRYPVTNAEFKAFVDATRYKPADDHNFLKDWANGAPRGGWEDKPVTWVSIEDARAYAKWAGKRLPHEWEWQYAAQGSDGRAYPWGNEVMPEAVPVPDHGRTMRGPDAVNAHPKGASPFGVMDMVGNVWQWTDEYLDDHTRAAVLRGGSYYRPSGSMWYFPQAQRLDLHAKYLLMSPGKDRSGALGIRCVRDLQ